MSTESRSIQNIIQATQQGLVPGPYEKAPEEHNDQMVELYGLAAFLIDKYIDRFIDTRAEYPPLGLVDIEGERINFLSHAHPFYTLNSGIHSSFFYEFLKTDSLRHRSDVREQQVYARLRKLLTNSDAHPRIHDFPSIHNIIMGGMGTATSMMTGILESIPVVDKRDAPSADHTIDRYITIARNSERILTKIASITIYAFGNFQNQTMDSKTGRLLKPSAFYLSQDPHPQLILNRKYDDILTANISELRCPAVHRVNGNSTALHRLWEWVLTLAPLAYEITKHKGTHTNI